jgi:hypothetical protein
MKIAICSSMVFTEQMLEAQCKLEELGHECFLSKFAQAFIGKTEKEKEELTFFYKTEKDAIREFWETIKDCDSVLALNFDRRGVRYYIGGNTFLELGFAYVLHKRIFLMNPIPEIIFYKSEIEAMKPIIIYGDFTQIRH